MLRLAHITFTGVNMNLPALPKHTITGPDGTGTYFNGHTDVAMQKYGILCNNIALDEAIALIDSLNGCSVEYIKDCLTKLKG